MFTTASYSADRHGFIAMPKLRCAEASWLRAPELTGEVSVQGIAVDGGVRFVSADVRTFPGTTAWSPPM